jgi:hypothetical protein
MAMTPSANFSGDLRSSGFWLSCLWPRITRFRIVSQRRTITDWWCSSPYESI